MTLAASHDGFTIDEHVYRRRWWTLAVLCTSLVIVIVGNTSLNVAGRLTGRPPAPPDRVTVMFTMTLPLTPSVAV